jgi:hypothetical protein
MGWEAKEEASSEMAPLSSYCASISTFGEGALRTIPASALRNRATKMGDQE